MVGPLPAAHEEEVVNGNAGLTTDWRALASASRKPRPCAEIATHTGSGAVFRVMRSLLAWVRIPSLEPLSTSQQSTQLSILLRSVNEYSEVTLRTQALDTH